MVAARHSYNSDDKSERAKGVYNLGMQAVAIILLTTAATILYGVVHDQVTVRVCLEYFTVFHRPRMLADSPTLLAIVWGFRATWWAGLIAGIVLMSVCRSGPLPKLTAAQLVRPLVIALTTMTVAAVIASVAGYITAGRGEAFPPETIIEQLPPDRWPVFVADWWAHRASYAIGAASILGIAIWAMVQRCRMSIGCNSLDGS